MAEECGYMTEECGYMAEERGYMVEEGRYIVEVRGYMMLVCFMLIWTDDAVLTTTSIINLRVLFFLPLPAGERRFPVRKMRHFLVQNMKMGYQLNKLN